MSRKPRRWIERLPITVKGLGTWCTRVPANTDFETWLRRELGLEVDDEPRTFINPKSIVRIKVREVP